MRTNLHDGERPVFGGVATSQRDGMAAPGLLYLTNERVIFELERTDADDSPSFVTLLPDVVATEARRVRVLGVFPGKRRLLALRLADGQTLRFLADDAAAWATALDNARRGVTPADPDPNVVRLTEWDAARPPIADVASNPVTPKTLWLRSYGEFAEAAEWDTVSGAVRFVPESEATRELCGFVWRVRAHFMFLYRLANVLRFRIDEREYLIDDQLRIEFDPSFIRRLRVCVDSAPVFEFVYEEPEDARPWDPFGMHSPEWFDLGLRTALAVRDQESSEHMYAFWEQADVLRET